MSADIPKAVAKHWDAIVKELEYRATLCYNCAKPNQKKALCAECADKLSYTNVGGEQQ